MKTIEVIVAPNGETKVETKGFLGASCRDASKFLEAALGIQTAERQTAEFYQSQPAEQSLRQEGGA